MYLAIMACVQKYDKVNFAIMTCEKYMRYGWGDHLGGDWDPGFRFIYIYIFIIYVYL